MSMYITKALLLWANVLAYQIFFFLNAFCYLYLFTQEFVIVFPAIVVAVQDGQHGVVFVI